MLIKTYGAAVQGIDAIVVTIEVSVHQGVGFSLVGLPRHCCKREFSARTDRLGPVWHEVAP